jgi:site-specific DNA-cytosine methylase
MGFRRAVDLFAGAGGLTLGLKQAGFEIVGAVESDAVAAETYRKNHRGVYSFSLARGKEHAALLIGNAFPPRMIRCVAKGVRRHLESLSRGDGRDA